MGNSLRENNKMKRNRQETIVIYLNKEEKEKITDAKKEIEKTENIEISFSELGRLGFERIINTDTKTIKQELTYGGI